MVMVSPTPKELQTQLPSRSTQKPRSWETGGRAATTGVQLGADRAPGLMSCFSCYKIIGIIIQQTWQWSTELFSTSLFPPLLQIFQFIHVRGELNAIVEMISVEKLMSTLTVHFGGNFFSQGELPTTLSFQSEGCFQVSKVSLFVICSPFTT